jgi:hypothetical protein
MTGYYDAVLGLIPVSLAGISGALTAVGVELSTAIPLASLVAVALIGHAMFVNAPVDTSPSVSDSQPARHDSSFSAD